MILKSNISSYQTRALISLLRIIKRTKNKIIDYNQEDKLDHFSKMQKLSQVLMDIFTQSHVRKISKIVDLICHFLLQYMNIHFVTSLKMIKSIRF